MNCSRLAGDVEISYSTELIDKSAFQGCSSLNSIKILNKDIEINDYNYTIPSNIKIIGYEGSTAEAYATKYSRTFEAID